MKEVIITKNNSIGFEEVYFEWFQCPVCLGGNYIATFFNFCPNCGIKIKWELKSKEKHQNGM